MPCLTNVNLFYRLGDRVSFQAFANGKLFTSPFGTQLPAEKQLVTSEVILSASIVDKVITNANVNFVGMMFSLNSVRFS